MGLNNNNNKFHGLEGNGRTPTIFTPWISQAEAGSLSHPTYSLGGEDSWPSLLFSPDHEQTDYRQPSVPESTPSTPPLLYDTVSLGPMFDCSGVADLILHKVSAAHSFCKEKETTSSARIVLPPPAAPVRANFVALSSRIPLANDTFGTLKHGSLATDSLLHLGKEDQVEKTSNLLPGDVGWEVGDGEKVEHGGGKEVLDPCAINEARTRNEQWPQNLAMNEEYLTDYRKGRHPNTVTLQKSDHMRRERDRRIALKLMYKTLDSMIPKPSKKSKRDRTAIVDDALKYVKALQEKLEKLRVRGAGVHRSSSLRQRRQGYPGHENLVACSTSELPRCSGDTGSQDQLECIEHEADSLVMEPDVDVFIGCGNEVLINISCKPRAKLVSCVLGALELLCLDVHQYSFSKLLQELVHCNFKAKQKQVSKETPARQMIEEVLKSVLK